MRTYIFTEEHKRKISAAKRGKHRETPWMHYQKSEEIKRKISESKKGSIPWNKGKGTKYYQQSLLPQKEIARAIGYSNRGSRGGGWKGGISSLNDKIRKSIKYQQWRKSVFERDNYTCLICGKVGGRINAHHIKSFSKYPELRFEISNGVTLCTECHYLKRKEDFQIG